MSGFQKDEWKVQNNNYLVGMASVSNNNILNNMDVDYEYDNN